MTHANRPTPDELKYVYVDLNFTQEMMALKYHVPVNTIKNWIAKAGIVKGKGNKDGCDAPDPG